jgi:hypothetical protein
MLNFKDITYDSAEEIEPFLKNQNYRLCDYTIGCLVMWAGYFKYQYCIRDEMLYIKGSSSSGSSDVTFTVPVGYGSFKESVLLLRDFCREKNIPLTFSAVPEEMLPAFKSIFNIRIKKLDNWSDYLYDSLDLSTYKGKKFHRKKNHVNKFLKSFPDFKYERISKDNIEQVREFFRSYERNIDKDNDLFRYEEKMVESYLNNYYLTGFPGGALIADGKVVAFTVGEILNDTLYIHVEKAMREYSGAYETISLYFAQDMVNDNIKYINREEDLGDEGLRKSKRSFNPIALLDKYFVEVLGD